MGRAEGGRVATTPCALGGSATWTRVFSGLTDWRGKTRKFPQVVPFSWSERGKTLSFLNRPLLRGIPFFHSPSSATAHFPPPHRLGPSGLPTTYFFFCFFHFF